MQSEIFEYLVYNYIIKQINIKFLVEYKMEVKERIMEEFVKLFVQKSCKEILVDEIAYNIGISKRTMYENFSSKSEIIRETLKHYLLLEHEKMKLLASQEDNALRKILKITHSFIKNANLISTARIEELKKQYPEIAKELMTIQEQFLNDVIRKLVINAQKEGYIFEDLTAELLFALLLGGKNDPRQSTIKFMGVEINAIQFFMMHFFTILRGVSTKKGVDSCDEYFREYLSEYISQKNINLLTK